MISHAAVGGTNPEGQNRWHHAFRMLLHCQLQLPMDFWQVSLASTSKGPGSPNVALVWWWISISFRFASAWSTGS